MLNQNSIYQFFSGFNIKEKNGMYVSGGFLEDITQWNKPVPKPIQNAINEKYFSIPDGATPEQNQIALIAREIDQYSVLAVVNRQLDDKDRAICGYRYFWLYRGNETNIDGIGTLLCWWHKKKQPQFQMEYLANKNIAKVEATEQIYQKSFLNEKEDLRELPKIAQQQDNIPYLDLVKNRNEESYPEYFIVHYLAYFLSGKFARQVSWAWNINNLEKPQSFVSICCNNQANLEKIKQKIHSSIQQTNLSQEKEGSEPNSSEDNAKFQKDQKQKLCLEELIKTFTQRKTIDEKRALKLFCYFYQYSNTNDLVDFIIKKVMVHKSIEDKQIYEALIYLINPKRLPNWSNEIVQSLLNSDKSVSQNYQLALKFQRELLEVSYENKDNNYDSFDIYNWFTSSLSQGISTLLLSLDTSQYTSSIKWLLIDGDTAFSKYFPTYADNLLNELLNQNPRSDFAKKIYPEVEKVGTLWLLSGELYLDETHRNKYYYISNLFRDINYHNLSMFLLTLNKNRSGKKFSSTLNLNNFYEIRNNQKTDNQLKDNQQSNSQQTNNQSTNPQSTNHQLTNYQLTNYQSTNYQSTNYQSTNSPKKYKPRNKINWNYIFENFIIPLLIFLFVTLALIIVKLVSP